jgi:hypothetical protein
MKDHGYDVSAHYEVHPTLGDMQTFDAVVREAHALGLRVLLDMVWAHTFDRHSWFEFSRSSPHDPRSDWCGRMRVPMALSRQLAVGARCQRCCANRSAKVCLRT